MNRWLTIACLGLCTAAYAQSDYNKILRTDPYESNGYFIVDTEKAQQLGVTRLEVDILKRKQLPGDQEQLTQLQSFVIAGTHYGHADPYLLLDVEDDERIIYTLTGFDEFDNVVVDVQGHSGEPTLPPICSSICNRNRYGWKLTANSDGFNTTIDITNPGTCFYVKDTDWNNFKILNDPTDLGLGPWYLYDGTPPIAPNIDCFKINANWPLNAKDQNGYPLFPAHSQSQPVWAIRKDKGEWRDLWAYSEHVGSQPMCDNGGVFLKDYYNQNSTVQAAILNIPDDPGPLSCPNGSYYAGSNIGGNSLHVNCRYTPLTSNEYVLQEDGTINIVTHTLFVLDCFEMQGRRCPPSQPPCAPYPGPQPPGYTIEEALEMLSTVSGVIINQWDSSTFTNVISARIPKMGNGKVDPRLVPIPRTSLSPGLYEIMILMDDGEIIRQFEEIKQTVTIGASFASFVGITVYPVPVANRMFAVDFDLLAPLNISMSIVNNMGASYYSKELSFGIPGRNKHLVEMRSIWPNGLYHAVFQFSDGSSQSISFIVDIN